MKSAFSKRVFALLLCFALISICGCADNGGGLIADAELSASGYNLGDYIGDYTVTDVEGNSYTFSELLKTKKAIVRVFSTQKEKLSLLLLSGFSM